MAGAPLELCVGGKEAEMQLQAVGSGLEHCSQARLHRWQSGHVEEVCSAEGCRAVLTKHSSLLKVCVDYISS